MRGGLWSVLVALAVVCGSATAQAQCTKDIDCKGERICDAGQCVAPPPTAAPPLDAAVAPAAPPAATQPSTREPRAPEDDRRFFDDDTAVQRPRKVKKRIKNPGLLVAGIVVTSAAPVVLIYGVLSSICDRSGPAYSTSSSSTCGSDSNLGVYALGFFGLLGAGIPMIVIGAKREPVGTMHLTPWVSPQSSGLSLRLNL